MYIEVEQKYGNTFGFIFIENHVNRHGFYSPKIQQQSIKYHWRYSAKYIKLKGFLYFVQIL